MRDCRISLFELHGLDVIYRQGGTPAVCVHCGKWLGVISDGFLSSGAGSVPSIVDIVVLSSLIRTSPHIRPVTPQLACLWSTHC